MGEGAFSTTVSKHVDGKDSDWLMIVQIKLLVSLLFRSLGLTLTPKLVMILLTLSAPGSYKHSRILTRFGPI
jgi:hypothetical protein